MKGRKGMELRGTKIALAAVLTCLLSLTAWLGVSQLTARADDTGTASSDAKAFYRYWDDSIRVTFGEEGNGYEFFTVANASKSVPAANQWIKTDDGFVNLSGKTGAAIYYFAHTTSPEIEDIVAVEVPAVPTISKAKYNAKGDAGKKLEVVTKSSYFDVGSWKQKSSGKITETDLTKIRFSVGVPGVGEETVQVKNESKITNVFEDEYLPKLQKAGATIYVSVQPAYDVDVDGDESCTTATAKAVNGAPPKVGIKNIISFSQTEPGKMSYLRAGAVKAVKIAKIKAGPAVTVDYVNHAINLKKGTAAWKQLTAVAEVVSGNATQKYADGAKLYETTPGAEDYYVVASVDSTGKVASSLTHAVIKADQSMASAGATAVISGLKGSDATVQINQTKADSDKNISYQYAISDTDYTASGNAGEYFDYAASKALKWKTITVKKTKLNATATIKASALTGKSFVYVRKAAIAKQGVFSSQVVEFAVPTDNSGWTMRALGESSATEVPYVNVTYAGNRDFNVKVATDGAALVAGANTGDYQIKAGKVVFSVDTDASANASADAVITSEALGKKKELPVKLTIPAGYVKKGNVSNAAYTISLKANTLVPAHVSKNDKSDTTSVTFAFDTTLSASEVTDMVFTVKDASGNAKATQPSAPAPSGKTITFSGLAAGESVTLTSFKFGVVGSTGFGLNDVKVEATLTTKK